MFFEMKQMPRETIGFFIDNGKASGMTKRKEHLVRALRRGLPRLAALLCCAVSVSAAFFVMDKKFRIVTVTDTDSQQVQHVYAGTSDEAVLLEAADCTLGQHDAAVLAARSDGGVQLNILRAFNVSIEADGADGGIKMSHGTVAQALEKAGVVLSGDDYTEPSLDSLVQEGMQEIVVHRVTYEERTQTEPVPFETKYVVEGDPETSRYEHDILRSEGADGEQLVTIRDRYVDGVYEKSEVVNTEITVEPTPQVYAKVYNNIVSPLEAPEGITVNSEHVPSEYSTVYTMKATGYYSPRGKGASGLGLYYGTFAVDPTLIPYGTKVYIVSTDGKFVYGWAIATDTGGFIHSNRMQVDLFYETYEESAANGVKEVYVYVP